METSTWKCARPGSIRNGPGAHTQVEGSAAELCRLPCQERRRERLHVIKSLVKLRPVRHRTDLKVRAHVALCMLALYVEQELTLKLAKDNISAELAFEQLETCHVDLYAGRGAQADAYVVPLPRGSRRGC